jgi:hypothetical protein
LQRHVDEAGVLFDLLQKYEPKTEDGSDHEEMLDVVKDFQQLAEDRIYELQQLALDLAGQG